MIRLNGIEYRYVDGTAEMYERGDLSEQEILHIESLLNLWFRNGDPGEKYTEPIVEVAIDVSNLDAEYGEGE